MLSMLLGWMPIIGPIIQGLTSVFNKVQDKQIQQIKSDTTIAVTETQTSAQIIHDTAEDIGVRFMRDLALFPPVVWSALIGWDTVVAQRYPNWMFHVADYPATVSYIPYAAFAFLFGNIGFNIWKRR